MSENHKTSYLGIAPVLNSCSVRPDTASPTGVVPIFMQAQYGK
jgi:hypothetical protein